MIGGIADQDLGPVREQELTDGTTPGKDGTRGADRQPENLKETDVTWKNQVTTANEALRNVHLPGIYLKTVKEKRK